jgi:acetolactate synthase-1/2/3 large subunit
VATLILPADVSWSEGASPTRMSRPTAPKAASAEVVEAIATLLRDGGRTAMLLGGRALREAGLIAAGRVAAATGTRLLGEVFPARLQRGAGLPAVQRIPYFPEPAMKQLDGLEHLILVDAKAPVSFFAYPGLNGDLVPDGCAVHELAAPNADVLGSLEALVEALGAGHAEPAAQPASRPVRPAGPLTAEKVCQAIGLILPEGAIVSDEAVTAGMNLPAHTAGAPRHDWLTLTGGAIGQGLPLAVGAAVACPDRPVFALQADGASLYTIQSLWTMAREQLNITVVIFNNRSYAILKVELARVGAQGAGPKANAQLDLSAPDLDFVKLGTGFGVSSCRVDTAEQLIDALERGVADPGPHLIEVVLPSAGANVASAG